MRQGRLLPPHCRALLRSLATAAAPRSRPTAPRGRHQKQSCGRHDTARGATRDDLARARARRLRPVLRNRRTSAKSNSGSESCHDNPVPHTHRLPSEGPEYGGTGAVSGFVKCIVEARLGGSEWALRRSRYKSGQSAETPAPFVLRVRRRPPLPRGSAAALATGCPVVFRARGA